MRAERREVRVRRGGCAVWVGRRGRRRQKEASQRGNGFVLAAWAGQRTWLVTTKVPNLITSFVSGGMATATACACTSGSAGRAIAGVGRRAWMRWRGWWAGWRWRCDAMSQWMGRLAARASDPGRAQVRESACGIAVEGSQYSEKSWRVGPACRRLSLLVAAMERRY